MCIFGHATGLLFCRGVDYSMVAVLTRSAQYPPTTNGMRARLMDLHQATAANALHSLPNWVNNLDISRLMQQRFVVCGTRHLAGWAVEFLRHHQLVAVVDDYMAANKGQFLGMPCITTETMLQMAKADPDLIFINSGEPYGGVEHFNRQAYFYGLRMLNVPQFLRLHGLAHPQMGLNDKTYFSVTMSQFERFMALESLFGDDFSKRTYYALLTYYLSQDINYLHAVCRPVQTLYYKQEFIEFGPDESVVDAGAFMGETIQFYLDRTQGQFNQIYAFEPNPVSFKHMQALVERMPIANKADRIHLYNKGLYNQNGPLRLAMTETNLDSHLTSEVSGFVGLSQSYDEQSLTSGAIQNEIIEVVRLDDVIQERPVTFIKWEVEGSEQAALQGAQETILRNRPRMSLSVYHKPTDFIELLPWVAELDLGYQFGLRQHNTFNSSTECYLYY
jgi:FkbM family methyltransferase